MTGRWFRGAHRLWPAGASVLATSALGAALAGQTQAPAPFPGMLGEHPVIDYRGTPPRDVVATVNDALAAGSRTLGHDSRTGYLPAVLDALGISSASQLLVFSKTGLQRAHTGPRTPRALYFNEAVIPDVTQPDTSVDGGVAWINMPVNNTYTVSALKPGVTYGTVKFSITEADVKNGVQLYIASPPDSLEGDNDSPPGEP